MKGQTMTEQKKTEIIDKIPSPHRKSNMVNCRNFPCCNNNKGTCMLESITLAPSGGLIDRVICAEAGE